MQRFDNPYLTTFSLEQPSENDRDRFPVICRLVEGVRNKIAVDETLLLKHYISGYQDSEGKHRVNTHFSIDGFEGEVTLDDTFQNEIAFCEAALPMLINLIQSKTATV